jgi:hypothetical protein
MYGRVADRRARTRRGGGLRFVLASPSIAAGGDGGEQDGAQDRAEQNGYRTMHHRFLVRR